MGFEFVKKHKGEVYAYNSENQMLYIRRGQYTDRIAMTEHQALVLLADLYAGTVQPLDVYLERVTTVGRDSVGACPRCGYRGVQ